MTAIPIDAISRLNPHARGGAGIWGSGLARAIYAYKELAALVAVQREAASLRFVAWQGKCAWCTNGRYSHWDWTDGHTVRCRDCRGTGIRTLRFTETRFTSGQVWHHPWEGNDRPGRSLANSILGLNWFYGDGYDGHATDAGQVIEWRPVGDWAPLKQAGKLPLSELVALLNEVEDWIDSPGSRPEFGSPWVRETALRHLRPRRSSTSWSEGDGPEPGYSLDLGRAPGGCFVCGAEPSRSYGRITPHFHWSLPVCQQHGEGPEKVDHPKGPPPEELITPDIRRWLQRHERVELVL